MDTMENTGMGMGSYGFIIFFILLFWVFGGGNVFGGCGNRGWGRTCDDVSNCQVEKQTIINTAETNFLIEKRTAEVEGALGAKIDFYAYQDLRDRLAEAQRQNLMLENKLYSDAQFNALNSKLDGIACRQLKAPEFLPYGGYVAATCGNNGTGCGCC